MRTVLLGLLVCVATAGCVSSARRCQGSLQPINTAPQPKAAQPSAAADPRASNPNP